MFISARCAPPQGREEPFLYAPWAAAAPEALIDLLSALPVLDVNGLVMAAMSAPPDAGERRDLGIAAFFAADPFLRARDFVSLLRRSGFRRASNFPTVQIIDGECGRALDLAGAGSQREVETLTALAAAGLEITAFACTLAQARAFMKAGACRIVLHPGAPVRDWRERASACMALAQTASALRAESPAVAIAVYECRGYGAELKPALAAAQDFVRWSPT